MDNKIRIFICASWKEPSLLQRKSLHRKKNSNQSLWIGAKTVPVKLNGIYLIITVVLMKVFFYSAFIIAIGALNGLVLAPFSCDRHIPAYISEIVSFIQFLQLHSFVKDSSFSQHRQSFGDFQWIYVRTSELGWCWALHEFISNVMSIFIGTVVVYAIHKHSISISHSRYLCLQRASLISV